MAVRLITITNLSNQVIPVLCGDIPRADSTGNFPYSYAGQIQIAPHKVVTIEESRVDIGQLESLGRKNLVSYIVQ